MFETLTITKSHIKHVPNILEKYTQNHIKSGSINCQILKSTDSDKIMKNLVYTVIEMRS